MNIIEKFYEIMEKEDDFDELIEEVEEMLEAEKKKVNINEYAHFSDTDVFDSCGLDIYYLTICWIDKDGKLQIEGTSYYLN